jgi:hypothetical protein
MTDQSVYNVPAATDIVHEDFGSTRARKMPGNAGCQFEGTVPLPVASRENAPSQAISSVSHLCIPPVVVVSPAPTRVVERSCAN